MTDMTDKERFLNETFWPTKYYTTPTYAGFDEGCADTKQKRMFIAHWIVLDILMRTEKHFVDWIKYRVVPNIQYQLYIDPDGVVVSWYYDDIHQCIVRGHIHYEKTNNCVIKIQAIIRGHNLRWRYPLIHIL